MSKSAPRSHSRYSREAAQLFGRAVRTARAERRMTAAELAERAGLSRGLVHRIESGDMGCSIGAVFEAAAVAGVPLFDAEPDALTRRLAAAEGGLALLPKSVRRSPKAVKDDF